MAIPHRLGAWCLGSLLLGWALACLGCGTRVPAPEVPVAEPIKVLPRSTPKPPSPADQHVAAAEKHVAEAKAELKVAKKEKQEERNAPIARFFLWLAGVFGLLFILSVLGGVFTPFGIGRQTFIHAAEVFALLIVGSFLAYSLVPYFLLIAIGTAGVAAIWLYVRYKHRSG